MSVNWDDLKTVLALVRAGSLMGAADQLGVSYTTVARRIARAEDALGATLFDRLADGYRPTEAGRLAAQEAVGMETHQDSLLRGLAAQAEHLAGPLVLTAPQLVISYLLGPVLRDFTDAHPEVDLQIRATNETLDLTRREADLAIRVSNDPGDSLTGQRMAEQATASFGTPDWAEQVASGGGLDWIVFAGRASLPGAVIEAYPGSRIRYRFDDMVAMVGAARDGMGIVRLPMFLGRAVPELVQLPCIPPTPYTDMWVVAHADVWATPRPKAFREVLRRHLPRIRAACAG